MGGQQHVPAIGPYPFNRNTGRPQSQPERFDKGKFPAPTGIRTLGLPDRVPVTVPTNSYVAHRQSSRAPGLFSVGIFYNCHIHAYIQYNMLCLYLELSTCK